MSVSAKIAFFDDLSKRWDGFHDMEVLSRRLDDGLEKLGVGKEERVMDVGCGTGTLTQALLRRLSSEGSVVAVDYSPAMVAKGKKKIGDSRVNWMIANVESLDVPDSDFDRVICYSAWPHFDDFNAAARELARTLKPAGSLHIWHLASKETINDIHAGAGEAVNRDVLPPAKDLAKIIEGAGLTVTECVDNDDGYLVSAVKEK